MKTPLLFMACACMCVAKDDVRLPPSGHFSIRESSCSCSEASCWSRKYKVWLMPDSPGCNWKVSRWWLTCLFILICCLHLSIQTTARNGGWASVPWLQKRTPLVGADKFHFIWLNLNFAIKREEHWVYHLICEHGFWYSHTVNTCKKGAEAHSECWSSAFTKRFSPAPSPAPPAE